MLFSIRMPRPILLVAAIFCRLFAIVAFLLSLLFDPLDIACLRMRLVNIYDVVIKQRNSGIAWDDRGTTPPELLSQISV